MTRCLSGESLSRPFESINDTRVTATAATRTSISPTCWGADDQPPAGGRNGAGGGFGGVGSATPGGWLVAGFGFCSGFCSGFGFGGGSGSGVVGADPDPGSGVGLGGLAFSAVGG